MGTVWFLKHGEYFENNTMDFQFLQSLRPNISEYATVDDDDDGTIAVAEFVVNIKWISWY